MGPTVALDSREPTKATQDTGLVPTGVLEDRPDYDGGWVIEEEGPRASKTHYLICWRQLNGGLGTSGEGFGPSIFEQEAEEELFSTLVEEPLGMAPIQAYTFDGKPIIFRPKIKKFKSNAIVSPGLYSTM